MNNLPDTTPLLILMPSVKVFRQADGKQFITQKFIEGVCQYIKEWPGQIEVFVEQSHLSDSNLDKVNIDQITEFTLTITDFDHIETKLATITSPAVVLASIHYRQNTVAEKCRQYNIHCVQTSEYTLKTRLQIIRANKKHFLKRCRGYLWEYLQERKNRHSIRLSSAVQCNGLPTYNAYNKLNNNCLLYFDSRVHKKDIIEQEHLNQRLQYCLEGKPLRLVFSGRLNAMKGADHLILVARTLRQLDVDFHLTICGDGDLVSSMRQQIEKWHLNQHIELAGVLDFHHQLLPFVKEKADLFICCHRQGDPSCTYIETMSCGVPLVSYDNEAFAGLQQTSGSGWSIKMDHYKLMAKAIKELNSNRQEIADHALRAREFAAGHTFETTFSKRIDHLKDVVIS